MSKKLFDDSDDNLEEDNFQIKTNENYAKTYNNLRKKELLQKFKDKGLEASESESDDSDSSEEDEVLDPSFDQEFLKTLASLKSKDPAIYDKNTKFFKNQETDDESSDEEGKSNKSKENKSKPITLKDYERKIILENGGKFEDDTDEENEEQTKRPVSPTVVEEERRLKAEFKKVMNQEDSSDEEFGGIFKKREKTKAEKDKEEEDYLKWLAGKKETIEEEVKEKLEPLKKYWNNDKLPSSEKFLRDYVLNKGYTEATNYNEIPTYEEIVGDNAPLSEDEQELEKQAEFEHKYNFRYEEPDQEFIKRYPRTIESSLRITDDKRKKKRQEIKERKLQEKQQKMKELEMVKEMKRKEIQEKIEKLKLVTGNDELGFKDDDLEEDFDPEAHDRRMKELFNDEYYQVDEGEEKPDVPSDIEELKVEDWDNYNPEDDDYDGGDYDYNNEPHCEDEDFNMDCDYDPARAKEELQKELIENTKRRRSGRKGRRDRFMEIIKTEKPVFDPEDEKTYGEYIDEYYKLDCEDIIGDIPCRFKYVETTPNDFGLTIEEILLAKNKELNQWASLKKAIQIRPDFVEKKEQRLYKMKAKNEELKRKIFKSLYGEGSDEENEPEETKEKTTSNTETLNITENNNTNPPQGESKKAKKRRKRKAQNAQATQQVNANGEQESSENKLNEENKEKEDETPAKKAKIEEETKVGGGENNKNVTAETITEANNKKKKKNKKKRQNQIQTETGNSNEENQLTNNTGTTTNSSNQGNKNNKNPFAKESTAKQAQDRNNFTNNSKPLSKNNPFAKQNMQTNGTDTLPPLRKNLPKTKTFNGKFKPNNKFKPNDKFKSKFQNKKSFNVKHKTGSKDDGKNISDERLKAYGINPRKFHKKQKYGNSANKS